jgi:hypothetical protein
VLHRAPKGEKELHAPVKKTPSTASATARRLRPRPRRARQSDLRGRHRRCPPGKLCGLRWIDIYLDVGAMTVARSVSDAGRDVSVKDSKTHRSRRIALDPTTVAVPRDHGRLVGELPPPSVTRSPTFTRRPPVVLLPPPTRGQEKPTGGSPGLTATHACRRSIRCPQLGGRCNEVPPRYPLDPHRRRTRPAEGGAGST